MVRKHILQRRKLQIDSGRTLPLEVLQTEVFAALRLPLPRGHRFQALEGQRRLQPREGKTRKHTKERPQTAGKIPQKVIVLGKE